MISLVLLVLAAAAWALFRYNAHRGVEAEVAKLRALGLPSSPLELDAYYKHLPAAENAALVTLEASLQHVQAPSSLEREIDLGERPPGEPLAPEVQTVLADYIAKNSATLETLRRAALLPDSRFPVDFSRGAATSLPHLAPVKALVRLLSWNAVYQSGRGNRDAAVESIETALATARTLADEPVLISELVRIASVGITLHALERVVTEHSLSEAQLESLARQLEQTERQGHRGLLRSLAGERAISLATFKLPLTALDQMGSGAGMNASAPALAMATFFQLRGALGLRDREMVFYLNAIRSYEAAATNEFPELVRATEEIGEYVDEQITAHPIRFLVARMLLPGIANAGRKEALSAATLRCARVALAIERYRLQHGGQLPARLEDLVPDFFPAVPRDAFDGGSLVFARLESRGYQVESPGASAERQQNLGRSRRSSETNRFRVDFTVQR